MKMFWCYCGQSIKNTEIPLNIQNKKIILQNIKDDEIRVTEIKEVIIEEQIKDEKQKVVIEDEEQKVVVEDEEQINTEDEFDLKIIENKILDEIINDIYFVINSKQNLIKMINNMKDITVSQMKKDLLINKYKSKKYIINNITHLVLNEPYNMIIMIDNNQINITELSNKIESYINEKFDYILLDKYWIIECYKILNDEKLIEIKKLLLLDNIPNNISPSDNHEIIIENLSNVYININSNIEIIEPFMTEQQIGETTLLNQPNQQN